jgi:hypothetical protein
MALAAGSGSSRRSSIITSKLASLLRFGKLLDVRVSLLLRGVKMCYLTLPHELPHGSGHASCSTSDIFGVCRYESNHLEHTADWTVSMPGVDAWCVRCLHLRSGEVRTRTRDAGGVGRSLEEGVWERGSVVEIRLP